MGWAPSRSVLAHLRTPTPPPPSAPARSFPPPGLAPRERPFARHPGRLESGHLQSAAGPALRRLISYINSQGDDFLHPDFGSFRGDGIPDTVVGAGQPKLPVNYTAYGDESDRGPFPVPGKAPVEGGRGSDGDRHALVLDSGACKLYELYRAFFVTKPRPHGTPTRGSPGT